MAFLLGLSVPPTDIRQAQPVREADGMLCFHPAAPPTDDDVRRVVVRVRRRLERSVPACLAIGDGCIHHKLERGDRSGHTRGGRAAAAIR
jgi:hypothetical protein